MGKVWIFVSLAAFGAVLATASACDHTPPFAVEKAKMGDHSALVPGDTLRVLRPAQEGYEGMHPGYYVVRSEDEWKALFEKGQERPLPASVDFARNMVVVSAGTPEIAKTHVGRVLDTPNTIHVYVQDTLRGQGCVVEKGTASAYQVAVTDRLDKNVKVHVDTEQAPGCGEAPVAKVQCRVQSDQNWTNKITANPGDPIECEAQIDAKGAFVVVDKSWAFGELPGGSLSKMTFTHENMRVSFNVDIFGTYKPVFEVSDEANRKGSAAGFVEVSPPKTPDVFMQMVWAGFDPSDDPTTFPRVELVVKDMPAGRGQKEKVCSLAANPKPDFCEIKGGAGGTNLTIKGSAGHGYIVGVHYTDDRYDGGPYICLRVYVNGARTADTCDRYKRAAEDMWNLGAVDGTAGTFMDAGKAFQLFHNPAAASADAGAPPAGDGGAPSIPKVTPKATAATPGKPTPPPPAPKK